MAGLQHARIGASLEVASASLAGHRFEKHSHDEFVISANLCGLEDVWLDGRTFQADSGDLTLYNRGRSRAAASATASPGASPASICLPPNWRAAWIFPPSSSTARCCAIRRWAASWPPASKPCWPATASPANGARSACWSSSAACWRRAAPPAAEGRSWAPGCRPPAGAARRAPGRAAGPGWDVGAGGPVEIPPAAGVQEGHRAQPAPVEHATAHPPCPRPVAPWPGGGRGGHALGFADQSHLTRYFTSAYGISPGRYQRAVRG